MFVITNTRIVGLIAVVCAIIAAPQAALAASSTHSRIAPPGDESSGFDLGDLKNGRAVFTAATPDAVQGNDLSGFDLSDLNNIPGYQQQQEYLRELARAALAAASPHKSLRAGSRAAAIEALQRRSVALDAAYRKLYPGAYGLPVLAVKTAPVVCNGQPGYDYIYSGCDG
jgi:hypothetical protein